ncbi:MAG TPA: UDP-N-acetylmuramoyl-L-alanine--D-glutamate ligase [Zoogloea sp.]|uniref:UDP-N-acetylmuramoyl-L-alanine--D-glutamate ligase n=1 Tax=Zoogloea sp. TaxID=49181 RepID=UPI002B67A172|nr:UDP-N-acetylmuramoyl-L-alanine--D-glutamate ligase [Zoogloea sp.]HMV16261.1 UDP-N-acetylmuramoyl-L-alanine--D-glutamate ligase [Rhodocyclaceae bacterium]HMV62636.1 UDP-N-acetylmuramoyl-L-alanine--D-glutamate ligase [Rhodocyclaceae bacterium]HMY48614.1 UDP-N-acetylmuramoyl-L-alanine--D-glutamate ligase [Rhodocyclaceae bacterium]HMZ75347.1 UDP-N-acetylmuramoyl-L-alanine--D-glutamate ligase [Rhodocyclaceae bacterium]HNA68129.1 UDP-N-acetylmuramoyl-L-alanine--D-glutamate ligase [Rhodocyclaceae 
MAADLTLILGLGESGLAMARWLARQGVALRVADSRERPPGVERLRAEAPAAEVVAGPFSDALLEGVTRIAISPGLDPRQPLVATARARGLTVVGEMDLFVQALRDLGVRDATRLIAITGTNGKTTTTTLAGEMVRACGVDGVVAGNISPAALDVLMARLDAGEALPAVWVLELSSFQLETHPALEAISATVLNVTDDHLDRYAGLDDYAATKAAVFQGAGVQVLNREDARVAAMAVPGRRVYSFGVDAPAGPDDFGLRTDAGGEWLVRGDERLLARADLPLPGNHNIANALAALALCEAAGLPRAPLLAALKAFRGLPHRVEKVARRADGVVYYDDSKGTNVGATVAALEGLRARVVLIVGGDGKGQDFSPLKDAFARYARAVVLIGRDAPAIEAAVAGCGVPLIPAADMDAAVLAADARAQAGDVVLLSPACASLDMFRNYAHRAQVFIDAVRRLPGVRPA